MTQRKHFKRLVRTRAAATAESYAAALRSIRQHRPEDRMPASASPTTATENPIASCSFCDKPSTAVEKLVAGPAVYICNTCVDLSASIIAADKDAAPEESAKRRAQFTDPSAQDILTMLPGVARLAARVDADLARWVGRLREKGTGWPQIGEALGISADAARQRFDL